METEAPEGATGPARVTRADVLPAAQLRFLRGERLDMRALALELGVSRATLYRWCGDRDRLLGEVVWSFAGAMHADARAGAAHLSGVERMLAILETFLRGTAASMPLRRFIETDAEAALRILTSRHGVVQPALLEITTQIIRDEIARGTFDVDVDPEILAFAIVRVTEAFVYNDTIIALEPDIDAALAVVGLMLGAPARDRAL